MTQLKRYTILDILRGLAIISMVFYHALWDIVYIFNVDFPWYGSEIVSIWQASIRWAFILLSGFCWPMGKDLKRGLMVLGCSVVISLVTMIFMPDSLILFGVLSLLGTGMVVLVPLDKIFQKISPYAGLLMSWLLFILTRDMGIGRLAIGDLVIIELPEAFYANYLTAYLGFPFDGFVSSDYVPLIPWLFAHWMGYFLYHIFERNNLLRFLSAFRLRWLEWLGRHSLSIYMLHQPVVYGGLFVFFSLVN